MSEESQDDKRRTFQAVKKIYQKEHEPICIKCGRYIPWGKGEMEVHHIKALFDGGDNEKTNLVPLCKQCHHDLHFWTDIEEQSFYKWASVPPGTLMEITLMEYGKEYLIFMIDHWEQIKDAHTKFNQIEAKREEYQKARMSQSSQLK